MKKLKHNSQYAYMDEDYEVQLEMIAKIAESECYKAKLINRLSELEELRQATHDIIKELLKDKELFEDVLSTSLADCLGKMFFLAFMALAVLTGGAGFCLLFGSSGSSIISGVMCIMVSICMIWPGIVSIRDEEITKDIIQRKLVNTKHYIDHKVVISKALSNSIETIKRKIEDINYDLRNR